MAALVVAGLVVSGQGAGATPATPAGKGGSESVIVLLHDQLAASPATKAHVSARRSQATTAQDGVLSRLSGTRPTRVKHFSLGNAFSATVTPAQAAALAADPAVASVVPDTTVSVTPQDPAPATQAAPSSAKPAATSADGPYAVCPSDPSKPLLEPEALKTMRAASTDGSPSAQDLVDGTGVKVAYIADGIDPNNADLIRPNGEHVITDYQDFSGDGPNSPTSGAEAFGDASGIAAQGTVVHDLSQFANPAAISLPTGCNIRIVGVAPGASIVAIKAGGELLPNSAILQAIDYAVTVDHVDVINQSFGANVYPDNGARNTIALFDDQAVAAGVTVVASTGDAGVTSTIGSPATDANVISTAASTDSQGYAQTGYGAFRFSTNGKWANDNISALSSSGITQDGRTVDLLAPGEADWAVCGGAAFSGCASYQGTPSTVQLFGGTSQSAPLTSGTAALVIQAYRQTHRGASPAPALVKQLLTSTAHDLGLPAYEQGSGRIDARAAVEAAMTAPGATNVPSGLSANVLLSKGQVTLEGAPGSTQSTTLKVTNIGSKSQTVSAGTRTFASLSKATQTTTFDSTTLPTFPYATTGAPWAYKKITFTVPPGADRLVTSMIWKGDPKQVGGTTVTPVVRDTLIDPDGTYQANSRPQGGAATPNVANLDVRHPKAGTWTAVLYSLSGAAGYTGDVTFQAVAQRAVPNGQVSPAVLSLAPGQTKSVHVSFVTPGIGGDVDRSITFGSSGGHRTSVSAVVRTLVSTSHRSGRFAGTIIGGNARAYAPAQTFSYAFDVPKGKHDLDVSTVLSHDGGDLLEGVLVDPNGETPDIGTNLQIDADGNVVGQSRGLQLTVANPIPGRWRFVVVVQNPVTGDEVAQDFTGTVGFDRVRVRATGLPRSTGTTLRAGKATTATVKVTNTGVAPLAVQTDARTSSLQTQQLAPQFASATFDLPLTPTSSVPAYLVPPGTTSVSLAAASTTPAQVELSSVGGGIDVFGDLKDAQGGSTLSVAQVSEQRGTVGTGYWFSFVQQIGPFPDGGAPAGTSTLNASAQTPGFDSALTSSTGDPYLSAVDPTASPGAPVIIAPGKSATITVKITPSGQKGSRISGLLNIVTTPLGAGTFNTTGDLIAQLPYKYTVG
ncbi:MAG TPA: S8 family serine peptidase [Jatrophihabitantaceae bacterium]